MKKLKRLTMIAAALMCGVMAAAVFAGCFVGKDGGGGGGGGGGVIPPEGGTIQIMWDGTVFLVDFEDIDTEINHMETAIANGMLEDSVYYRNMIENTKIMRDHAKERNLSIQSMALGWDDTLTTALTQAFSMEDGPDIIIGEAQLPGFVNNGYIAPYPDGLAAKIRELCSKASYTALEKDGKIYGFAITPGLTCLVWNKALLRQVYASTDPIIDNGPKDWEQWKEAMSRVYNNINGSGKPPYGGGVYVAPNTGGYLRTAALLDSNGGGYADPDTGAPSINSAQNQQAFQFLRDSRAYNINGICNASSEETYDKFFSDGETAFKVDGNWAMAYAQEDGIDWGMSLIPPRAEGGDYGTLLIGATYMCVPQYSQNKDHAFYLIEKMLDERIHKNIAEVGRRLPVLNSVIDSAEFKAGNPKGFEIADYARNAANLSGLPPFKGRVKDIWNAVGTALTSTYITGSTPAITAVLNTAQTSMMNEYNR